MMLLSIICKKKYTIETVLKVFAFVPVTKVKLT